MNDERTVAAQPTAGDSSDLLSKGSKNKNKEREERVAFKVNHVLLSIFFLWIFIVHAVGLYFFTKGFLLTRLVLDNQSQCAVLPDGTPSLAKNGCWHPKSFEKAVVVVIDALRYDFAVPFQTSENEPVPHLYHNNFPILYNTAVQRPENAILLPFIADPPTSTLQRLKALTAGNLPTFIDISSSFAGSATEEDNLLVQLNNTGKKIVHLGDDTWHSLFPGHFEPNLTRAYDSFNVWDLHTVDNGVIEHILPLLQKTDKSRWDVVFAHMLGVDHAGHRYGPDHQAMAEKLKQMNIVVGDIMRSVDDDTLLVVMGDHGMDPKGDHGGESDEEVESTLWMYSRKPKFGRYEEAHRQPPLTAKERPVQQIDFVSTLSLLLGLPIPFNNLGTPIADAFVGAGKVNSENLARVNLLAYDQIQRYQSEYTKSRDLETSQRQLQALQSLTEAQSSSSNARWRDINVAYQEWHHETVMIYRKLWANFDSTDMLCGVVLSVLGLVMLFTFCQLVRPETANNMPSLVRNIVGLSIMGASTGRLLSLFIPSLGFLNGILFGSCAAGSAYVLSSTIYTQKDLRWLKPSIWGWLALVFTVSQAAGFASNSYTIHEDTILLFFLSTFGAVSLASSLRQGVRADRILGTYHSILFILLTRVASYSRLCREEQMPGCRSTFYASQTSSTSAPWQLLIPFTIAIVLPEIIKAFYKGSASYTGSAGLWIGFAMRIGLLLVAVYWTVDAIDNANWVADKVSSSTLKTTSITVARCVYAIAIPVGIGIFVWSKPCIDVTVVQAKEATELSPGAPRPRPQITVLGYANTFGSRYYLMVPVLVLCIIVLLPPMGQLSFAILTWQILSLLEILDTNHLTITSTGFTSIGPIILAMLGSYHFFKTGHQAVLSSIQWNAAFVPFRTVTYPFAPLLVLLNTFGAQILCAAAVPLTVLWKRPVSKSGLRGLWSDVTKACLAHVLYYATIQLATTMWAGHLRRHLMLYRVFMPRFLMASGILLVVDLILILISLPSVKVSAESVAEVFGY